jgi:acyl carrier protein
MGAFQQMATSLRDRLQTVFRNVFDDPTLEINDSMTADDLDDWDSVMHITLLVNIEQEFGIRFSTEDVMVVANVGQFIQLLEKKLAGIPRMIN